MTTELQIGEARKFAGSLLDIKGVSTSIVDDWDNYGGFNIFVYLTMSKGKMPKDISLRKITNAIRKKMKLYNACILQVPIRQYEKSFGQYYFIRYDYDYVKIDLRIPGAYYD